jgi:hypothetical protein
VSITTAYNAQGLYRTIVSTANARNLWMGMEGGQNTVNTGQYFYYAAVEIRLDTWPGPIR